MCVMYVFMCPSQEVHRQHFRQKVLTFLTIVVILVLQPIYTKPNNTLQLSKRNPHTKSASGIKMYLTSCSHTYQVYKNVLYLVYLYIERLKLNLTVKIKEILTKHSHSNLREIPGELSGLKSAKCSDGN